MKKIIILLVIVTAILVGYFLFEPIFLHNAGRKELPKAPQNLAKKHSDSSLIALDSILSGSYRDLKTPAISAAIGTDGTLLWANAKGWTDIDKALPASTESLFRIGSTSKALTSVGLGILKDQGALALHTKVNELVPYHNELIGQLSVQQLASHTSGIRNYETCFCFPIWENMNTKNYTSVEEAIKLFEDDPLLFEPGSSFSYSTYNFTLLSAIMEGVTKTSFPEFMTENVFNSLKMEHTFAEGIAPLGDEEPKFYDLDANKYKEVFPVNNSVKWAGGGFLSTPSDLVKFGNAVLNFTLISEKTTKILWEPVRLNNGEINPQNYALGWRNDRSSKVIDEKNKVHIIHHGGTAAGGTSFLVLFPEYNMSISLLINRSSESFNLAEHLYRLARPMIQKIKNDKMHSQNVEAAL